MRRVQVLAGAAMVLLATACTDRPNDLDTYYDETSSSQAPSTTTTTAPTTTTAAAPEPIDPATVALTTTDLAAEEVQPGAAPDPTVLAALPDCAAPLLPLAVSGLTTVWKYPSGSVLRQYVAVHEAGAAPVITGISAALTCSTFTADGQRFRIDSTAVPAILPGVQTQHAWCASGPRRSMCTLALGESDVLTIVTVEAASLPRAQAAIARLGPAAAAKLALAGELPD